MKLVKKALAITLAVMLILPSVGALADEAESAVASEATKQKQTAEPEGEAANEETVSGDAVPIKKAPEEIKTELSADAD